MTLGRANFEKHAAFLAGQKSRDDEVTRLLVGLREIEQKACGDCGRIARAAIALNLEMDRK
jgi:hypothetical protein